MSGPFGSSQWMYNSGSSFYSTQINDSLRFEDGSSAYLNRTPASAGNRKTWTYSVWLKRGANITATVQNHALLSNSDGSQGLYLRVNPNDPKIEFTCGNGSLVTNALYRDHSAWYHIVAQYDSANSVMKLYVNGEQVTDLATNTQPSLNTDGNVNDGNAHYIGRQGTLSRYLDGYLSDIHFIDGTALDPTSFGEAKDGTWIPKSYSGSYGTNGFHLEFNGNSNDTSGNGNNWTANNISAHDYVPDSPTNNFATLNPIGSGSNIVYSEGNLKISDLDSDANSLGTSTFSFASGKYYFEHLVQHSDTDFCHIGVTDVSAYDAVGFDNYLGSRADQWSIFLGNDEKRNNGVFVSYGSAFVTDDIMMCAVDMDSGKIWWGKNGTWFASGDPAAGTNAGYTTLSGYEVTPAVSVRDGGVFNFGQDSTFAGNTTAGGNSDANGVGDFKYAPPSGYLALCTANLPEPTIIDGSENFTIMLHIGTGSQQVVTGAGFAPDFRWTKSRGTAYSHLLHDNVRGETAYLQSNTTNAENTLANMSLDSDGFTVHADDLGDPHVSWLWKAGGTAVSNTAGSITSQVSANVDAGFSIVSWTGTGSAATIGHSLGVQPSMIIVKNRIDGRNWSVWHKDLSSNDHYLRLDSTDAQASAGANYWNSTAPTSSVFSVGVEGDVNDSGDAMIAYCFANTDGYLKAGSYIGNGSSNGPFIYTGFRPSWILARSVGVSHWIMFDVARHPFNDNDNRLFANLPNAEDVGSAYSFDFLSNGFKARHSGSDMNANGQTHIYLAFAENPFNYANAR